MSFGYGYQTLHPLDSLVFSWVLLSLSREVRLYVFIHAYFLTVELRETQLNIRRKFFLVLVRVDHSSALCVSVLG